MSDALSGIGSFFGGSGGQGLNSILGLAGTGANLFSGYENFENTQAANNQQKQAEAILSDPKKLQALVAGIQQPLSAGLTAGVENQVQGNLAEKGLATSPAAMQSAIAQALAPYIQQNQQTALNSVMQQLQMKMGIRPNMLPMTNISNLLKMISSKNAGDTSGPNPGEFDFSSIPDIDTSFLNYDTGTEGN